MDVMPAETAVLVQAEKYFELSFNDYLNDLNENPNERALSQKEAVRIGMAAIMFGVLNRMVHFSDSSFEDIETVVPTLISLPFVAKNDLPKILTTFREMLHYKFIRAEHPLEEWVAEMCWWLAFDEYKYPPPTAMTRFIERLLQGRHVMDGFVVRVI